MQVSQNWFGEHERALATGILAMSLPLGIHKSLFIFIFTVLFRNLGNSSACTYLFNSVYAHWLAESIE
jgi:hypothetical protein